VNLISSLVSIRQTDNHQQKPTANQLLSPLFSVRDCVCLLIEPAENWHSKVAERNQLLPGSSSFFPATGINNDRPNFSTPKLRITFWKNRFGKLPGSTQKAVGILKRGKAWVARWALPMSSTLIRSQIVEPT